MENKHPEHFWSEYNSLSENKKKFEFRNPLNHFIFQKFFSKFQKFHRQIKCNKEKTAKEYRYQRHTQPSFSAAAQKR